MRWWSEPPWPPGERERARTVLTSREYDALRLRRAGYSVTASAVWLGCGEHAVRSALKRADATLEANTSPPVPARERVPLRP